jgi:hypothetical protein
MHIKSFLFTGCLNKRPIFLLLPLLLITATSSAQRDTIRSIQEKLNKYADIAQEKIFLHNDKDFYTVGEVLWFKAYLVNGLTHKPTEASKVGYIELLDSKNTPVLQAKISLEKENSDGSFYLPATLGTGFYKLRAYTNWMKNFGVDGFFEKAIAVVNPFNEIPAKPQNKASFYLDFFPEGGNLVNNLDNKVAFKINDQYGKGVQGHGFLLNEKNDTLLRFEPYKFGMGHFFFTPRSNEHYTAAFVLPDGNVITKSLPQAYTQGYVLSVTQAMNNQLKVKIQQSGNSNKPVYLLAHNQQVVKTAETLSLTKDSTILYLDKNKLGDGIVQLTLFDAQQQPVCERLVFNHPTHLLTITANSDAEFYDHRALVNFTIQTKDKANIPIPSSLSLSVFQIDSLQSADQSTIVSYLWLTSNLAGKIECPEYYFSKTPQAEEAMENLLLTHGWRRFRLADVLAGKKETIEFDAELTGHIITGQIINKQSKRPAPNVSASLSIPDSTIKYYTNKSDKDGLIYFTVPDFYNTKDIIVQYHFGDKHHLNISSPFSEDYSNTLLPHYLIDQVDQDLLAKHSIDAQVQNVFAKEHLSRFSTPTAKSVPFYGKSLRTYMLDDYTRFPTMEEVLREYVTEINVRKREGKLEVALLGLPEKQSIKLHPLILIDGVPVYNQEKLFTFDPLKVKKIDVATGKYVTDDTTFNGIASFTTFQGNLSGQPFEPNTLIQQYESLQSKREFYAPIYETESQKQSRLPDFRNVLFWAPTINTSNSGKGSASFYTSDRKGKYVAILQGVTADGKAGSTTLSFEVK